MLRLLEKLGAWFLGGLGRMTNMLGLAWTALWLAPQPRYWTAPVRNVLARQIFFTGVEGMRFVMTLGLLVGVSVVVQAQLWLGKVGQSSLLGPVLVAVIVREAGPLLVNFVIIGRSGTAMAAEMATMRVNHEIDVLDAQGLDPMVYLLLPRAVGMMVSVFCLTMIFIFSTFISGFLMAQALGLTTSTPAIFFDRVFKSLHHMDVINLLIKTLVPGLLTAVICCTEGLGVRGASTDIPFAATRGLSRSITALFVVSALVSFLTYV